MKTIRAPTDVGTITHVGIRTIVERRICELRLIPPETLPDLGVFIVAEVGDTPNQLQQAAGCGLFCDLDGTPYGDPEFSPAFEWLEHHTDLKCFELLFIMTDDGYFTVLFIPDNPEMPPDLINLCRDYAL